MEAVKRRRNIKNQKYFCLPSFDIFNSVYIPSNINSFSLIYVCKENWFKYYFNKKYSHQKII